MNIGTMFWVLMILCLLAILFGGWPATVVGVQSFAPLGGSLLSWVLLGLLGWQVFGPMLKKS